MPTRVYPEQVIVRRIINALRREYGLSREEARAVRLYDAVIMLEHLGEGRGSSAPSLGDEIQSKWAALAAKPVNPWT